MVDRYDFDVESEGGCDMCGAIAEKCNTGDYVLYEDYAKLEAENKRLKEVLGVYADINNWGESSPLSDYKVFRVGFTGSDGWEIAQEALKGNE